MCKSISRYGNEIYVLALLIVSLLLSGTASAGVISINGTTYDTTWDGRSIPTSKIIIGSNNDGILETDNANNKSFTLGNKTITYSKSNRTTFKRTTYSVSPSLTFNKTNLTNWMVNFNATVAYLPIPFKLSGSIDWNDAHNIRFGNWRFDTGITIYDDNATVNVLPVSTYDFKIVSGEPRVYFLKSEANKLQGNVTFELHSWIAVNGSTTPAWVNTSFDNLTINYGTYNLELQQQVKDYISKWRGDNTTKDDNRTSAYDGTVNGGMSYNSGLYNSAFNFTGSNYITNTFTPTKNFSIAFMFFPTQNTSNKDIFSTGSQGYSASQYDVGRLLVAVNGSYWYSFANRIQSNAWNKIQITYENNQSQKTYINVYVNGVNIVSDNPNPISKDSTTSTFRLSGGGFFNTNQVGLLDEISVFDYVIQPNQVGLINNHTYFSNGNAIFQVNFTAGNQGSIWNATFSGNMTGNASADNSIYESNSTNRTSDQNNTIPSINKNQTQYIMINVTDPNWSMTNMTIYDESTSTPSTYMPPTPINLTNIRGNFWVNYTWSSGSGNITDSYNVSLLNNSIQFWTNGSSQTWTNSTLGANQWSNITVYAYNNSGTGTMNATGISQNTQAPGNGTPNIIAWGNNKTNDQSQTITINVSEYLYLNISSNQTLTQFNWSKDTVDQNMNYDNITVSWDISGRRNLSIIGSNANGSTQMLSWTIEVRSNITNRFDTISDSYISSTTPASNYGNSTQLLVYEDAISTRKIFFNFSNITYSETIENATFNFYINSFTANTNGGTIRKITSSWTEDGITYNTYPTASLLSSFSLSTGWNAIDISNTVKSWANGSSPNHGISIFTCTGISEEEPCEINISSREDVNYNASYIQIILAPPIIYRNVSESISVENTVSRTSLNLRDVLLSVSISDLVSRTVTFPRAVIQTFSISETTTRIADYRRSFSQSLGISDTVSRAATYIRGASQSFGISDTVSRLRTIIRNIIQVFTADHNANANKTAAPPSNVTTISCLGWCYLAQNYTSSTLLEIDTRNSNDTVHTYFNASSQKWESHRTGYKFNENISVPQKYGYGVYFSSATNVNVTLLNATISLKAGWNLIGNMNTSARNLGVLKTSTGATQAQYYDRSSKAWGTANSTNVPAGESFFAYMASGSSWSD